jgi:hypothetical protein
VGRRVAPGREIVVGGVLILISASLIAVTRGLVMIRPGLILIARRLVAVARGLIASSGDMTRHWSQQLARELRAAGFTHEDRRRLAAGWTPDTHRHLLLLAPGKCPVRATLYPRSPVASSLLPAVK